MDWFGPRTHIEVVELENELLIRATGLKYWFNIFLPLGVSIGISYIAWRDRSLAATLGVIAVILVGSFDWFRSRNAELKVTENDLEATGYLGKGSNEYVHLVWPEIRDLKYQVGSKSRSSGLVAMTGKWSSTCLMADLSEEQTDEVIGAIYRHFPYLEMAKDSGSWSLFGGGSEIMTLGLSKSDEASSRK